MVNEVRTSVGNVLPEVSIDYIHEEAHRGKLFRFGLRNPALAAHTTMKMVFVTSSKEVHFHPSIETTGPIYQDIYEDGYCSNTGTGFKITNFNRSFTTSAGLTAGYSATCSDGGIIWNSMVVGNTASSVRGETTVGGASNPGAEIILKPNSTYYAQLVNASLTQIMINFQCYFYEE